MALCHSYERSCYLLCDFYYILTKYSSEWYENHYFNIYNRLRTEYELIKSDFVGDLFKIEDVPLPKVTDVKNCSITYVEYYYRDSKMLKYPIIRFQTKESLFYRVPERNYFDGKVIDKNLLYEMLAFYYYALGVHVDRKDRKSLDTALQLLESFQLYFQRLGVWCPKIYNERKVKKTTTSEEDGGITYYNMRFLMKPVKVALIDVPIRFPVTKRELPEKISICNYTLVLTPCTLGRTLAGLASSSVRSIDINRIVKQHIDDNDYVNSCHDLYTLIHTSSNTTTQETSYSPIPFNREDRILGHPFSISDIRQQLEECQRRQKYRPVLVIVNGWSYIFWTFYTAYLVAVDIACFSHLWFKNLQVLLHRVGFRKHIGSKSEMYKINFLGSTILIHVKEMQ